MKSPKYLEINNTCSKNLRFSGLPEIRKQWLWNPTFQTLCFRILHDILIEKKTLQLTTSCHKSLTKCTFRFPSKSIGDYLRFQSKTPMKISTNLNDQNDFSRHLGASGSIGDRIFSKWISGYSSRSDASVQVTRRRNLHILVLAFQICCLSCQQLTKLPRESSFAGGCQKWWLGRQSQHGKAES